MAKREANGVLIAAAPELLAAAEDVYRAMRSRAHEISCRNHACRLCRLRKAIAEAHHGKKRPKAASR